MSGRAGFVGVYNPKDSQPSTQEHKVPGSARAFFTSINFDSVCIPPLSFKNRFCDILSRT